MAHDEREAGAEERPSERRRKHKKDRDPDSPHKSRSSRSSKVDPNTGETIKSSSRRKKEKKDSEAGRSKTEISMAETAPEIASRTSLPYPSFSKAHSKEAVNSAPKLNVYTPDPTDLEDTLKKSQSADSLKKSTSRQKHEAPPTPPETEPITTANTSKVTSTGSRGSRSSKLKGEKGSKESFRGVQLPSSDEDSSNPASRSKLSDSIPPTKSKSTRASTVQDEEVKSFKSPQSVESNATVIPPGMKAKTRRPPPAEIKISDPESSSAEDSSPQTPTQTPSPYLNANSKTSTANTSAVPPPPPPPPSVPVDAPRVDYLLQNGGLPRPIRKTLFDQDNLVTDVFSEQNKLFDQILTVMDKQGSLAVATGYVSIARRLLERTEVVMGRQLTSEKCNCVVCQEACKDPFTEPNTEVTWAEILERFSGRIESPAWPPFEFNDVGMKTAEAWLRSQKGPYYGPPRPGEPVRMDPDITEEYRAHYLGLKEKKKKEIDRWLTSCPEPTAALPDGLDDQTLTFTILTHIKSSLERSLFNALMTGSSEPIGSRASTPFQKNPKPRPEFIVKTGQALQRLYRLPTPPRDPETCLYLVKHPELHNMLLTLHAINQGEWEILTSGRFNGFLWSGAESEVPSMNSSPNVSRNTTPAFDMRRNQTPSKFSSPPNMRTSISKDEEIEMAINAEMERNIYRDMDAMEDLFEQLHRKAETVRQALRARNAALSYSRSQPQVVCGTPGLQNGNGGNGDTPYVSESENGWYDPQESELGPNDSASVIMPHRFKRPQRRNDRRTPALAEEDE